MSQTTTVMDPAVLRRAAGKTVGASKVLANEDRLRLLGQLSDGEMSVGELEKALEIHQPTLSQQLGVLRTEGIVNMRREGKRIFYSIAHPDVMQVLKILDRVYGTEKVTPGASNLSRLLNGCVRWTAPPLQRAACPWSFPQVAEARLWLPRSQRSRKRGE
jgi:ArsR family transcriptional regulator